MYGARQRPSHLICGLCPSITDTSIALRFPHMLIIHAVLDHDVSLEDVARARRSRHHLERLCGDYRTGASWWCCGR
jgi:hypothetical protein